MNAVQEIKQRHDMGIQKKMGKSRINAALARRGIPFRVV